MKNSSIPAELIGQEFAAQVLSPAEKNLHMEGVALAPGGQRIAVALSDTGSVHIYKRIPQSSLVYPAPQCMLLAGFSKLHYPHDVAFSTDEQLLVVADRNNAIQVYKIRTADGGYGPEPVCELRAEESELNHSDGVAFVPPYGEFLAACNLISSTITFYRQQPSNATQYGPAPCYTLQGAGVVQPDGLAFSHDGDWLAVANHGGHSVGVFRKLSSEPAGTIAFELNGIIKDDTVHYAHSVAFTPRYHHLLATNAGANYVNVYRHYVDQDDFTDWSNGPDQKLLIGNDEQFAEVNTRNKMEGGAKGIAIDDTTIAVCRPETGLSLFSYTEDPDGIVLNKIEDPPAF